MDATRTSSTAGVRRIRGIALALLLLALLGTGAGLLIHAVTTTATVTTVHRVSAASSTGAAQYPVGEGHQWSPPPGASEFAKGPIGEGHYPG